MTKAKLIAALADLPDDAPVNVVWVNEHGSYCGSDITGVED